MTPDLLSRPGRYPARRLDWIRPIAKRALRARWDVRVHGAEHVPARGPVILASNHIGILDGPFLGFFSPRSVHALTKREMFAGPAGVFLHHAGQIRLDRERVDPCAVKASAAVLARGEVLGIFPEGTRGDGEFRATKRGAAYLALVSGAPVVPVAFFGTRMPGAASGALPPKGERIDIVYSHPWQVPAQPWPRTREQVGNAQALLHEHLRSALDRARDLTGRELPGQLSGGETDGRAPRGAVDQGAS